MKRKRVYAHRTRKMREDFLAWLSKKNSLAHQAELSASATADPRAALAYMVWADDGGRLP